MEQPTGFLLPARPVESLDEYLASGGGAGIARAARIGPEATIEEIRSAGLRGRGGAGFPTGIKWAGLKADTCPTKYLVCNAAEGEPGTFKDRMLIRRNPYQLLEGIAIGARTLDVREAYIGIKSAFTVEIDRLQRAAEETAEADFFGDLPVTIVPGPDDYLFGEEKALLEVVEGNDPLPRLDPPFIRGLFTTPEQPANPAVVNNVETLSNIPHILRDGADRFHSFGTERSPGTMVFTVSGDVRREGVAELPMGTPLAMLVYGIGEGLEAGRRLKAVLSGASNGPLPASMIDTPMDFESMRRSGSGLGSGGMIVYDDTASMVDVAAVFSTFLSTSSCGQCPPCKVGSTTMTDLLEGLAAGAADTRRLEELAAWTVRVTDANRCGLGAAERDLVGGFLEVFWDEFAQQVTGAVPVERRIRLPKLREFDAEAGRFTVW